MSPGQPVLPMTRAAGNLRRTRRLLWLFALIALPSVAYVGQYVAFVFLLWVVPVFGGLGWPLFLALDVLAVIALMVFAFRRLHASATNRLLKAVRAQHPTENEAREFTRAAQNMSIASGLPMPDLYLVDVRAPNLLAIGLAPNASALVATRGLLEALDRRELEAVVAHAFAQIGNGDTRLDTLLATWVRFLKLPGTFAIRAGRFFGRTAARFGLVGWGCLALLAAWMFIPLALSIAWGLTDPDFWWICWIALTFLVYIFLLGPLLAVLVARKVGRERKHLADAEAVQLTRLPVGLARALAKVEAAGSAYAAPPETANLHFADPLAAGAGWWAHQTDSHPPVQERIAMASRLGGVVPPAETEAAAREGANFAAAPMLESRPEEPAAGEPMPGSTPASKPGPDLLRLLEDVPLLVSPRAGSETRGTVATGTRVSVLTHADGFTEVITPDDRVGWISKLAHTEAAD